MKRLAECDPRLQRIAFELIKEMDVSIICGHRNKADQNKAYRQGHSKLKWPESKHNKVPSLAVDVVPAPLDWSNIAAFEDMCSRAERIASELDIKIRLGRDFSFKDYPHIELVED
jgi:peptidoglycan LD-endopeptidase CwlK